MPIAAIIPLIAKGLSALVTKVVPKLLKKTGEKVLQKGVETAATKATQAAATNWMTRLGQTAATAAHSAKGGGNWMTRLGGAADNAADIMQLGGEKSNGEVIKNILTANVTDNLKSKIGKFTETKIGKSAQNLLGGESFGSKMFLNTIGNMGRQGAFSGSDVGQPDKDFWGMLGNSVASSLGQSVGQQRQDNFENRQTILKMAEDLDYSKEMLQRYQPKMAEWIDGIKSDLTNVLSSNMKRGIKGFKSEDLMSLQWRFIDAKKRIEDVNRNISEIKKAQDIIKQDKDGYWNREKFYKALDWSQNHDGATPPEGYLHANPMSPELFASTAQISKSWQWSQGDDFYARSPLSDRDRVDFLFANLNADKRTIAWYEDRGIDINDPAVRYREATKYANLVERPVYDAEAKMRWEEQQQDKRQRAADKAESAADKNKPKYKEVADYLGQGKAIVFDNAKTENLDKAYLEGIIGSKIQSDGNVIPITLERIDESGNLHVTYKDRMGTQSTTLPMSKASGLVDTFYPGASEASKNIRPKTEPSKSAMVYNKDMEDKIELFMDKNGIKDRAEAIRILRERKIL
jgi:hypothetical protein